MALFFKTENKYQGFVPDVLLPIKDKAKDVLWIITDIETYHKGTMFETGKNLCLTTEELLSINSIEEIQLLWAVFCAVKQIPDKIENIHLYAWHEYESYYSNIPKLDDAIIEIVFDDASGYLVKSEDKEFYEIYMNYYNNCKVY